MSELESRINQLTAELIRLYRHNKLDVARIAEIEAEIMRLESQKPRSEPSPEELRRAELERQIREARGRELAALRNLDMPFDSWEERRKRVEAYEAARKEREALEEQLKRR